MILEKRLGSGKKNIWIEIPNATPVDMPASAGHFAAIKKEMETVKMSYLQSCGLLFFLS